MQMKRRQTQARQIELLSLEDNLNPTRNEATPLLLQFRRPVNDFALDHWYDQSEALNIVHLSDGTTAPLVTRPEAAPLLKTHTAAPGEDRTPGPGMP
jgi:hypothetical protein